MGDNISALASAGAKQFLVLNVPDLSLVPAIRLQGAQAQQVAASLSEEFNKGLAQVLTNLQASYSIEIKAVDIFELLHDIAENPDEYDLKNVVDSCITPGVIVDAICNKPEKYLFWDGIHPTQKTHQLISETVIDLYKESKDKHKLGEKEEQPRYAEDQHEAHHEHR